VCFVALTLGFAEQTGRRLAMRSAVALLEAMAATRHARVAELALRVVVQAAVDGRDSVP